MRQLSSSRLTPDRVINKTLLDPSRYDAVGRAGAAIRIVSIWISPPQESQTNMQVPSAHIYLAEAFFAGRTTAVEATGSRKRTEDFSSLIERVASAMRDQIVVDPEIMGGTPVIRGTRVPVFVILDYLADGYSIDDVAADYPYLNTDQIRAAVAFASQVIASRSEV